MIPGDRQAIRAPPAAAQRPGLLRRPRGRPGRAARRGAAADLGHHAPLPRERAGAADAHPGARGPGADPAPRPGRVPGVAGVLRAPGGPPRGGRRPLAARGLPADAGAHRRDRRTRPRPRPGLLRRARAQVAAVRAGGPRRRAGGGDRVLPGRGRPGARAARRRARTAPIPRWTGSTSRTGQASGPGSPRSTTPGPRAELSPPSARGGRARRAGACRRPCWGR